MEVVKEFLLQFDWHALVKAGLRILMILILTWVGLKLFGKFLERTKRQLVSQSAVEGEPPSEAEKRVETIIRLVRQGVSLLVFATVLLVVLREFKVEIGPILASAGILGLAVGFGAQNLVRDVISGFFIILENQVRVGDVAIINGTGGLVERINFRTTVLRDLKGVVHVFPNGAITTLSNMTNDWSAYVFDIGVAYKENTDRVIEVLKGVTQELEKDKEYERLIVEPVEIFGVDQFGDSAVVIKGRIKTRPIMQWKVGREFLRRVKLAFDEQGIEIPFPHRTFYFGEASKPFDVSVMEKLKNETAKSGDPAKPSTASEDTRAY